MLSLIQLKSMRRKFKDLKTWFYRIILILILIFVANLGGIIALIDGWRNPPQREPNAQDLEINPREDLAFLNQTLERVFPEGTENLSAEEKTIEVLRFVVIDLKNINNLGTATKILQDGYAVCGGKAVVLQTLLRLLGIPTRTVELFNTPDSGHDLVETYYEGGWHAFDPSYGVFVYSNPSYDKEGKIIGMHELSQHRSMGFIQSVTDILATGQYSNESKSYGVKTLTANNPSLTDIWRKEITSADPIIYSGKNLYKYFYMIKTFNTADVKLKLSQIF